MAVSPGKALKLNCPVVSHPVSSMLPYDRANEPQVLIQCVCSVLKGEQIRVQHALVTLLCIKHVWPTSSRRVMPVADSRQPKSRYPLIASIPARSRARAQPVHAALPSSARRPPGGADDPAAPAACAAARRYAENRGGGGGGGGVEGDDGPAAHLFPDPPIALLDLGEQIRSSACASPLKRISSTEGLLSPGELP